MAAFSALIVMLSPETGSPTGTIVPSSTVIVLFAGPVTHSVTPGMSTEQVCAWALSGAARMAMEHPSAVPSISAPLPAARSGAGRKTVSADEEGEVGERRRIKRTQLLQSLPRLEPCLTACKR
ncbi:hypothetical protein D3C87_1566340 [compost metagenome]